MPKAERFHFRAINSNRHKKCLSLASCLTKALLLLSTLMPTALLARGGASEDTLAIAAFCLRETKERASAIASKLKAVGVEAVLPDENFNCHNSIYLSIPNGLETWVEQYLRKEKIRYSLTMGTAGGSGILKSRVKRVDFYTTKITPDNLRDASRELSCSLRERLSAYFDEVNVVEGCGGSVTREGLCFAFWIGGHLSDSKGLTPKMLNRQMDEGYWFTSREQLWVSYYADYREPNNESPPLGPTRDVYRIDLTTLSSKFARSPRSKRPEAARYRYASDAGSPEDDAIDQLIAHRLENIILSKPQNCEGGL